MWSGRGSLRSPELQTLDRYVAERPHSPATAGSPAIPCRNREGHPTNNRERYPVLASGPRRCYKLPAICCLNSRSPSYRKRLKWRERGGWRFCNGRERFADLSKPATSIRGTPMGANLDPARGTGRRFASWAPGAMKDVFVSGDFASTDGPRATRAGWSRRWSRILGGFRGGDQGRRPVQVLRRGEWGPPDTSATRTPATSRPRRPTPNSNVAWCGGEPGGLRFWHDGGWTAPDFSDLVVYQFHVGTFFGPDRENRVAKFLDVLDRIDYLVALGVNALEPLPVAEYSSPRSLGYDGSDLYAPEMEYYVDPPDLTTYLAKVKRPCYARRRGCRRWSPEESRSRSAAPSAQGVDQTSATSTAWP